MLKPCYFGQKHQYQEFNNMKDLINKNTTELQKMLALKQEAFRAFRFGIVGSKTKNVREGRDIRRGIARILTMLNKSEK